MKDRYFQILESKILILALILIVPRMSLSTQKHKKFKDLPIYQFLTVQSDPSIVKISPTQQQFVIGYENGLVKVYDIKSHKQNKTLNNHQGKIIDMQFTFSNGLITLDNQGKAIRWSQSYLFLNQWNLNLTQNFESIGLSILRTEFQSAQTYVAFNLGERIQQYSFNGSLINTILAPQNNSFTCIQYTGSKRQNIWTGLAKSSNLYIYHLLNDTKTQYLLETEASVKQFQLLDDLQTILIQSNTSEIYKLKYGGVDLQLGNFDNVNHLRYCSKNDQFILSYTSSSLLSQVSVNQGYQYYQLKYLKTIPINMDCSQKHLITIDSKGYVTLNQYSEQNSNDQSLTIAQIIGIICGVLAVIGVIVGVIYFVKKKKRNKKNQKKNPLYISQDQEENDSYGKVIKNESIESSLID